ncbi:superoxide dismutase family protein [Lentibacillus jeotgali]|uniref:superoxide dismutase family protein n=1 Tax=Lentibacillus jeotgali TaxID=558169 RepID=UPI0002626868|nr:superoxide dismutase family protein [Lentibacillus jeotgali]
MKRWIFLLVLLVVTFALASCGGNNNTDSDQQNNMGGSSNQNENASQKAVTVDLQSGEGESAGTATLEQVSEGVKVTLNGENIPKGTHGFHIHEKGTCEAPDFKSADGHFNPGNTKHGFDTSEGPHAGDMPNITVGEDGTVKMSYVAEDVTLEKGQDNSLLGDGGRALVIHQGKDDGKSQPSGDAGDRFACGTISE